MTFVARSGEGFVGASAGTTFWLALPTVPFEAEGAGEEALAGAEAV
jgi:hypothetical protein